MLVTFARSHFGKMAATILSGASFLLVDCVLALGSLPDFPNRAVNLCSLGQKRSV